MAVRNLTRRPGLHAVGGVAGLCLNVLPKDRAVVRDGQRVKVPKGSGGGATWILRTHIDGKRVQIGLGGFPTVTLSQARDSAREMLAAIRAGRDPVAERNAARAAARAARAATITFDGAVQQWLTVKKQEWSSEKKAKQIESALARYASPELGRMNVQDIELAHIVRVLEPHWQNKTETMTGVRARIEAVLDWSTVHGYRKGDNPARWKGFLDKVLPAPAKIKTAKHFDSMPYAEIPEFMAALKDRAGMGARALEFAILTGARSKEIRGATWAEIDVGKRVWTIPAARMKMRREHRVPLTDAALDVLERTGRGEMDGLVFPAPRGGQLSDMSISAVLKRMEVPVTVHGFRSTFRTWAAEETQYPREVCEVSLAHAIGSALEAAYNRGDLFQKRRNLLNDWADYCSGKAPATGGNVVSINQKAVMG
ncbi:tyrosine-type recombinase/integrase [Roseospirillum parvum]|uniref:tyrosine-type recombinase/integrase n=1 Tax=Roseospirillum parvum TaxID=83401 RepID=UPI001C409A9D|nr:site-specific integrase [Roseospirillum parvum]